MKNIITLCLVVVSFLNTQVFAQQDTSTYDLVQFSGVTLDGANDALEPIPFVTVVVEGTDRGTYSDWKGFFSVVAAKGDVIVFTAIGYKDVKFTIPDTLKDDRYSIVQLMTADTINLPETVIFPWPSREHFKLEFLAMEVTPELQSTAEKNLAEEKLIAMRSELPSDGRETGAIYMRQQAAQTYTLGNQAPPMNIFNPLAWKDFFKAWKNGDFKRE